AADPAAEAGMSGTLRVEMGSYNADKTEFAPVNYPSFVDIAISTSDSLQTIRDKINTAGSGVTASIVTDSSGSRLIVRSKTTGAESAFRLSVTDDDGDSSDASGLSSLGYDPTQGAAGMTLNKSASDATAVIDGLTVTSKTNTFTGALQGVSFVAKSVTSTPIDLTVSSDTKSMSDAVTSFATAYNNLASFLKDQTKYDAASKTAGTLQGDAGANALRSALRGLGTSTAGGSSVFSRLSEIGLDPQADGTLKIDTSKLSTAVANTDAMKQLFGANDASLTTDDGFGSQISDWSRSLLGIDGSVATRQVSLKSQLKANDKQQAAFEDRMSAVQARLTSQYNALDTQMSKMSALQTYVTQQIANWNKSTG
ncbi:MAG: flagellar filament capping protein FliD, partial [Burkholderiales bacterium]